jgi:hypothetical protein
MSELTAERCHAALHQAAWDLIGRPFPMFAMAATPKLPKDITSRSFQMPRDSCLLYPNRDPRGDDPAHYRGLMKDADGSLYWVGLWVRIVKGQKVLEIRRVPKT